MFFGYIYKITGACGNVYIGSTINISKRIYDHNNIKQNNTSSRYLEKPLVFKIIRLDEYKLKNTMYLVEQYYIDNIDCVNQNRAYSRKKLIKASQRKIKEECIYCKKIFSKVYMEKHHQSRDCRWARENPEMIKWYYAKSDY